MSSTPDTRPDSHLTQCLRWCMFVCAIVGASNSAAHSLGQSYIFMEVYDDSIEGTLEVTLGDLNTALNLNFKEDGTAEPADIEPHVDAIKGYLRERVRLVPDAIGQSLQLTAHELISIPLAQYVSVRFEFRDLEREPEFVDVEYRVLFDLIPEHRGILVIYNNFKSGAFDDEGNVALVFGPADPVQRLDLSSSSVWRGIGAMIGLGVHHIWIGIDHVLFLVALLLPSVVSRTSGKWQAVNGFRPALWHVIGVVTVFTVAHTITLSIAALTPVPISSRLVESIIALSIAVAALDVIVPIFGRRIWIIVFGFGLFHGFGFASVLSEIGIPSKYLVHSLLGFNVGVELGQLAIVCVVFPALYLLRGTAVYLSFVLVYGACGLILVSMYWFTERAFQIDLPAGELLHETLGAIGLG